MAKKKTFASETREGLLPEDYWMNPKAYADEIDVRSKAKVRRLLKAFWVENQGGGPVLPISYFKKYMMERVGFE